MIHCWTWSWHVLATFLFKVHSLITSEHCQHNLPLIHLPQTRTFASCDNWSVKYHAQYLLYSLKNNFRTFLDVDLPTASCHGSHRDLDLAWSGRRWRQPPKWRWVPWWKLCPPCTAKKRFSASKDGARRWGTSAAASLPWDFFYVGDQVTKLN